MKKQVIASFMLASSVISLLASCGGDTGTKDSALSADAGAQTTAEAVTQAETEEQLKSLLPDNLDFGGKEIRVMNGTYFENDGFMLSVEEQTGDVVNDAIFKRSVDLESKLNVKLTRQDYCVWLNDDPARLLNKSVSAGANDYDLVFGVQYNIVPQVLNNLFLNLEGEEYLHLDQPWWYQNHIKELSMGQGRTYFVTGDITLGVLRNMSCMYVNKSLFAQHFESADTIYQEVLDGKWTLDLLAERCTEMYQDLNGDGKSDEEDRFGIGVITASLCDHFTYDAGIRATARDENNIPYLVMNNEKTINFTQKLYSLYHENPGTYVFTADYNSLDVVMPGKLNDGSLLYLPGWFYTSELLRNMEVDYAVIPFPKYDEAQESYLSLAHDVSTLVCIPTTCAIVPEVTAAMEMMAFEGYKNILPAYYEVAIKVKYNRDNTDEAMQVLDIIHDNATTDFAYVYNYALNGVGLIERDLMGGKKADFASMYTKKEKSVQKKLDALIEVFTDLE